MEEDFAHQGVRHKVVFEAPAGQDSEQQPSILDEEREKHRRRAEKFGTEFVEPTKVRKDRELVLAARKERMGRQGFATGIDLFTEEEQQKRASRASRFNITEPQGLEYKADELELKKTQRAKKFGQQYEPTEGAMMDMDLFESRAEVPRDVDRRYDAIYLYGVDVMSTGDCLSYFTEYGPTFVEWINDSACVVTFEDKYSAARAMAGVGRPLPSDQAGGETNEGMDLADPVNMPYLWHKGRDFVKQNTPVHLIYRMAAVTDKKESSAPRRTRELWKLGQQSGGRGRGNKSRRTRHGQSAGHERVDHDGDIEMADAHDDEDGMDHDDDGYGDGGDSGSGRPGRRARRDRSRRRKQRQPDGTVTTTIHVEQLDYGEDEYPEDGDAAGMRKQVQDQDTAAGQENGSHRHHQQRQRIGPGQRSRRRQQQQNAAGGGDGGGDAAGGAAVDVASVDPEQLLQRILKAKKDRLKSKEDDGRQVDAMAQGDAT